MSNTKAGAAKVAATNKQKYGDDFYKRIGSKGGKVKSKPSGFAYLKAHNPDRLKEIARKASETRWKRKQNDPQ